MINRKDLTKKFEDVVKQEIANHQKVILQTNVTINEIKSDLQKLKKQHTNDSSDKSVKISDLCSHKEAMQINLSEYRERLDSWIKLAESKFATLEASFKELERIVIRSMNAFEDLNAKFIGLVRKDTDIEKKLKTIEEGLHSLIMHSKQCFEAEFNRLSLRLNEYSQGLEVCAKKSSKDKDLLVKNFESLLERMNVLEKKDAFMTRQLEWMIKKVGKE